MLRRQNTQVSNETPNAGPIQQAIPSSKLHPNGDDLQQQMVDMRERYAHLYRDHEALKLQLSSLHSKMDEVLNVQQNQGVVDLAITTQDRDKILKLLQKADKEFKDAWMLITEIRRMLEPERRTSRVHQDQVTGEQIPIFGENK